MHIRSNRSTLFALVLSASLAPTSAMATLAELDGGETSVLLDADTLASVGLTISSVSPDVIVPGNLGAESVAFAINSRSAAPPLLPTTFSYDPADFLGTFSGTIEHQGSVFFNGDTVEVGNFTIAFDGARVSGTTSGFYVESTVGVTAILFDVGIPSILEPTESNLTIAGDLLVSPEFADFLGNTELTGADVGDALVEGRVPVPATLALIVLGLAGLGYQRFRQKS